MGAEGRELTFFETFAFFVGRGEGGFASTGRAGVFLLFDTVGADFFDDSSAILALLLEAVAVFFSGRDGRVDEFLGEGEVARGCAAAFDGDASGAGGGVVGGFRVGRRGSVVFVDS